MQWCTNSSILTEKWKSNFKYIHWIRHLLFFCCHPSKAPEGHWILLGHCIDHLWVYLYVIHDHHITTKKWIATGRCCYWGYNNHADIHYAWSLTVALSPSLPFYTLVLFSSSRIILMLLRLSQTRETVVNLWINQLGFLSKGVSVLHKFKRVFITCSATSIYCFPVSYPLYT